MITTIQTNVKAAEDLLCEAVLATIFLAYRESQSASPPKTFSGISAMDISTRANIYREKGEAGMNDAIVHGILNKLADEKKVERPGSGLWTLTKAELDNRIQQAKAAT